MAANTFESVSFAPAARLAFAGTTAQTRKTIHTEASVHLRASVEYCQAKCFQSRSNRNTSFDGGSGACVSIQRTGSQPKFAKLWMQPTLVQITSPGPIS